MIDLVIRQINANNFNVNANNFKQKIMDTLYF